MLDKPYCFASYLFVREVHLKKKKKYIRKTQMFFKSLMPWKMFM